MSETSAKLTISGVTLLHDLEPGPGGVSNSKEGSPLTRRQLVLCVPGVCGDTSRNHNSNAPRERWHITKTIPAGVDDGTIPEVKTRCLNPCDASNSSEYG